MNPRYYCWALKKGRIEKFCDDLAPSAIEFEREIRNFIFRTGLALTSEQIETRLAVWRVTSLLGLSVAYFCRAEARVVYGNHREILSALSEVSAWIHRIDAQEFGLTENDWEVFLRDSPDQAA